MKRRALLSLGAGSIVGIAGCSALNLNEDTTLAFIELRNRTEESQTLDVLVRRDGELVHWSKYTLPSSRTTDDGAHTIIPSERILADEYDGCTPGVYMIDLRLGEGQRYSVERTAADRGQGIWMSLEPDGSITDGIHATGDSHC
ncbi:hypothetical protein SAMN04487950_0502 [Halogranum rubrum]|uniref:Lipoprotein n=1 Tax=Halogranum rubrum TaxID=553466 RepID=A0A1I4BGC1_9EURY|nr:hypothetical protein SAMN04487950_0502 [Halogranum rubrum]